MRGRAVALFAGTFLSLELVVPLGPKMEMSAGPAIPRTSFVRHAAPAFKAVSLGLD